MKEVRGESKEETTEEIIEKGIHYAPIKTLSRAVAKGGQYQFIPGIIGVKDWVRIALILENEKEMCAIFKAIWHILARGAVNGYLRMLRSPVLVYVYFQGNCPSKVAG